MQSNHGYADRSNEALVASAAIPASHPHAGQLAVMTPQLPAAAPAPVVPVSMSQGAFDIPSALVERIELCKLLSESDLVPRALQGKPANVLLIMHKALALDLPLMVAIEHLHVIDNKVGHSAELLRGLLARAGHILRWLEITDKSVTGELTLRHDPKHPRVETFTIGDATRMKLAGKDNWTKDPSSMLVARVTTRLVTRHCAEIAVALGNLSAQDVVDDQPAEPAAPSAADRYELAAELLAEAAKATTAEKLKTIGARARDAQLLDFTVDGVTVQNRLLARIDEIAAARKAKAESEAPA